MSPLIVLTLGLILALQQESASSYPADCVYVQDPRTGQLYQAFDLYDLYEVDCGSVAINGGAESSGGNGCNQDCYNYHGCAEYVDYAGTSSYPDYCLKCFDVSAPSAPAVSSAKRSWKRLFNGIRASHRFRHRKC
ncbi:hypothetical protein TKK_0008404 [Trichogramma kaykai]